MNTIMDEMYQNLGISKVVLDAGNRIEQELKPRFTNFDKVAEYNQLKVLHAMQKNRVNEGCFHYASGYGYNDQGRDTLEQVYADTFHTEAALVRPQITCGTHALALALSANLRPGDELLSPVGKPYDTLEEVIGIRPSKGSLAEYGITYRQVELLEDGYFDYPAIEKAINEKTKLITIQRSKGYSTRKSLTIETIERICKIVKSKNPNCICFVDNCYGEFVDTKEPLEVGADLIGGSLIKNPGGGIVEAGGYIAGKELYVERAANRLTAPGIGSEGGAMFNQHRLIFQGLFMAPSVVSEAVKGAVLASKIFDEIGFDSSPKYNEKRTDIIQNITFGSPEPLEHFCRTIQSLSPVNGYVTPIPEYIPGYEDQVIMAGGTFVEGSTIELSADGPMRAPYVAYMQGGLNYAHVKIALEKILDKVNK